jgi:hypothetical protein
MITDEDLLLYYYRDGLDDAERARIGTALSQQPALAQRLHRLVAQLDTAASSPDVPVPAHIQQRWQTALDRAAQGVRPAATRSRSAFRWQLIAAAVAALALIVTVRVSMQSPPNRTAHSTSPQSAADDAAAYERGLRWHLASTEQQLAKLDTAQPDERARLIETIIEQNRMYALAAERANEPQLARVLRAFAPILESLAHEGRDASASDLAQLNFELRVMQARLKAAAEPSATAQPIAL